MKIVNVENRLNRYGGLCNNNNNNYNEPCKVILEIDKSTGQTACETHANAN